MNRTSAGLGTLTRRQRELLRALLIETTGAAGRSVDAESMRYLVGAAPTIELPAAAALHRVGGSVLRGLEGVDDVPAEALAELTVLRQQSSLRHLLMTGALGEIAQMFDGEQLTWLAMKGPVVAALLYPEAGDRMYTDLDLLVGRRDFPRAVKILEHLGFQHRIRNWALAEKMLAGEIAMTRQSVCVDLHWHLHYSPQDRRPFAIDPEAMIERRRHVTVSGVAAPTFDPVDTLLTLAFHAARSDGHRLVWLKDAERSIVVEDPDLDELVRRCRQYHCAPPVGLILGRSQRLLGAPIPDEAVAALTPPALRIADRAVAKLTNPVQLHDRPTLTRWFTRSVRSSVLTSLSDAPTRTARSLRRRLAPQPINETDNPVEKDGYLTAVAASIDR